MMMKIDVTRRGFLRGMGVVLALPALEALGAPPVAPKRMVAINIPLGFYPPNFFPEQAGRGYAPSPYLRMAGALKDEMTVISGTSHPECDGGHDTEKTFLTAAPHPGSRSFRNTISLDQKVAKVIGKETRYASLSLGDHSLAWTANGVSIPMINRPEDAFAKLFLQGSPQDVAAQKQRLQDGRSIMDAVLEDARGMEGRASVADREKLDQYFSAVRETELSLTKAGTWVETPKPVVKENPPPRLKDEDVTGRLRGHYQVIRLALVTDTCRVLTLGGNSGGLVPPLRGVDTSYHGLSHHGKNPQMIAQLELVDRDTIQGWVEFLTALKETPDGDSHLLANTQVLMGSNLGNANGHLTVNLPIVLAGGPWKHGQHLAFDPAMNYPLARLFVSMMQGLGLEVESFASGAGTMRGLERKG
jgi:hypothetical protein